MQDAEDKKEAALQATQLCRQEAAAALSNKEMQTSQNRQALDMARAEIEQLQREVPADPATLSTGRSVLGIQHGSPLFLWASVPRSSQR